MEEFKLGNIVQLKSGGPKMTVSEPQGRNVSGKVFCQWFAGSKLEQGFFPKEAIEIAKNENKKET
jgi:uncharacterized protein YodC (DUF2158 family)